MTAQQIVDKYNTCNCGEIYTSRNLVAPDCPYHQFDWESAMKEIAELAFEAGREHKDVFGFSEYETEFLNNKEQFINQLFPPTP